MTTRTKRTAKPRQIEALIGSDRVLLKELMKEALQEVLEAEMTEALGAGPGERTADRVGYRSGYYSRGLVTRIGKLELRVPRDREGRFSTELFERYQRSEKALVSVLAEMYVQGVSTRKVKAITEELCGHTFSASTVSRINKSLDALLRRFAQRRLDEAYPYVILDARYEKVRLDGVIQSQAVFIALGINEEGRGRSLPDRRDAAHREGDLERAAELSREPNVHRGPGQYLEDRGRASATVAQAEAVEQRTATARAERDADRRQVERLEREIAAVGARLQETYDRVRRALDARVQQAGRAIRAGAERAVRAGRELGQAGAAVGRAIRAGAESAHRVGEYARGATTTTGRTCHDLDRRLRLAFGERQQNDRRLQRCYEGIERTFSMIHPEAEQKRKDGDRPDRVEGLIESRIQNRIRSRSYDFDR